ncbi:MAG: exopolysaccharide biosynthesis polyprenyl glycosylphosphotransferase [Gaiellaceae bacterium]
MRATETTRERLLALEQVSSGLRARARSGQRPLAWPRAALGIDALMLFAAVVVAELAAPRAGVPSTPLSWLFAFPLLIVFLLAIRGMYRPRLFMRTLDDLRAVTTTTALAAMIVLSLRVVLTDHTWTAAQTARLWAFAAVYLVAGRAILAWSELQARRRGEALQPTLLIGAGRIGRLTAARLLDHPEFGLRPIGFLDKEPLDEQNSRGQIPVLGASWDLEQVVEEHDVERVLVTFSTAPQHVLLNLVKRCEALGIQVSFVPRFFEKMSGRVDCEHLGGLPIMNVEPANPAGWQFSVKYALDRLVAGLLLLLVAPVLLTAALAVLATMGRPVFFRQVRAGRDGRAFEMLKIRTMHEPRGPSGSPSLPPDTAPGGVEGVDRRTPLGALLRRTSIDELPQLWNVLRGEMSLVGPRPERPEYVELFTEHVPRYGDRHRVKAGITGWAQVHGLRGKTSLADRVEWDNYYIENWSLWLDVKILLMTFAAVLSPRPVE